MLYRKKHNIFFLNNLNIDLNYNISNDNHNDDNHAQHDLYHTYSDMGKVHFAAGQYAEALADFEASIEVQQTGHIMMKSDPAVVETFYYTLHDADGESKHRNSAQVVSHHSSDYNVIKQKLEAASTMISEPGVEEEDFHNAVIDVVNGTSDYFNKFLYHSISTTPLTNEIFEYLPDQAQILWDGQRVSETPDGTLLATYKEDGNIITNEGSVSFSQIYPDGGSGETTTVPRVIFGVTGATGKYCHCVGDHVQQLTMIVDYDNEGTTFGDGSRKFLRRLRLVKGDWTKLEN